MNYTRCVMCFASKVSCPCTAGKVIRSIVVAPHVGKESIETYHLHCARPGAKTGRQGSVVIWVLWQRADQ